MGKLHVLCSKSSLHSAQICHESPQRCFDIGSFLQHSPVNLAPTVHLMPIKAMLVHAKLAWALNADMQH